MIAANSQEVLDIIASWKQFKSGHEPLSKVRNQIISAQENGTRFFAEDSAPELGPEMINDGALRHELTAAEMAFERRSLAAKVDTVPNFDPSPAPDVAAYVWLAERAVTNPYAHHIAVQDNIEIRPHHEIPREEAHDVPGLSEAQRKAAAIGSSEMTGAATALRSQAKVYFRDGQKGFEHITTEKMDLPVAEVIEQAGAANSFRSGMLRLTDGQALAEEKEKLRAKVVDYGFAKSRSLDQVNRQDWSFRNSMAAIPLKLDKVMSVSQTQAHPDGYTKAMAEDTLSSMKERYAQHMLKQGAGLREDPASRLVELSQKLPLVVSRSVRVTHDLGAFDAETSLSKLVSALNRNHIAPDDAHEILSDLEEFASPTSATALRSEAQSQPRMADQAKVLQTLIRDREPDLRGAISRSEYYDHSDVAVMSEARVEALSAQRTKGALSRLTSVLSSSALHENLNIVSQHKADASEELRPKMRAMP